MDTTSFEAGAARGRAWRCAAARVLAGALVAASGCSRPATQPASRPAPRGTGVVELFSGKDLTGWQVLDDGFYDGAGKVHVRNGQLILPAGEALTGVRWTGGFPGDDYEVTLEARRLGGPDFFCGMTFPVAGGHATLILGGWGGSIVGLSNVDDMPANDNETTAVIDFKDKRWYPVRVRVAEGRVTVWLDGRELIDLKTKDRRFEVWPQQEDCRPFGISTWFTTGALRNVTLRRL